MIIGDSPIDILPLGLAFLALCAISGSAYLIGVWISGSLRAGGEAGERSTSTIDVAAASALTLLSFLLAFQVGFALDRFDGRRELVAEEANAIRTAYLRAAYVPEPDGPAFQALAAPYVAARLALTHPDTRDAALTESERILGEMWSHAESRGESDPNSEAISLFIDATNEVLEIAARREVAIATWRMPIAMWVLMIVVAIITMLLFGMQTRHVSWRTMLAGGLLIVAFAATTYLIIDLDRPYEGVLQINQEALLHLQDFLAR